MVPVRSTWRILSEVRPRTWKCLTGIQEDIRGLLLLLRHAGQSKPAQQALPFVVALVLSFRCALLVLSSLATSLA